MICKTHLDLSAMHVLLNQVATTYYVHSFVSLLKTVTWPFYQNYQYALFVTALLQKLKNIPDSAQYMV